MKQKKKQIKFASKAEEKFVKELDDHGIPWSYEAMRIPWIPDVCYYKPDFIIDNKIVEFKGYFRPKDRVMLKKIKEQHPNLDIHLLFQKPKNKLHPSSKTTYADWARANDFKMVTVDDVLGWRKNT